MIDLDLRSYFDTVRHHIVLEKVARRVRDEEVLWLLRLLLKASGKQGVPQGGVISPLLSNVYLNEVDQMLERAKEVTRQGQWGVSQLVQMGLPVLPNGRLKGTFSSGRLDQEETRTRSECPRLCHE